MRPVPHLTVPIIRADSPVCKHKLRSGAEVVKFAPTSARKPDMVLAVYDPASARGDDVDKAVEYARQQDKPLRLIHPDTMVSGDAVG